MTSDTLRTLSDASQIPRLGLGVWQVPAGNACETAVRWALEAGYRHIDTAQAYGNEASVGRALRDSGVPREDVFLTTKFFPGNRDPHAEAQRSLERLAVEYVDLYIIHWPQGGPTWAWDGMQRTLAAGFTRAIGVSNFSAHELAQLDSVAEIKPVINQVQFSAFEYRLGLQQACAQRDIAVVGYSSLGTGRHLAHATIVKIAQDCERTPAQVLLRWCLQRDVIVIPKSTKRERIIENAQLFDFALDDQQLATLDYLDHTDGTDEAREDKWWS